MCIGENLFTPTFTSPTRKLSHFWTSCADASPISGPDVLPPSLAALESDNAARAQPDTGKSRDDHRLMAETKKPPVPAEGGSGPPEARTPRRYCSRA